MKESLSLIQVVDYTVVKECLSVNKVIDCFSVDCIPVKERLSVIQVVDCTPVKEGLYCDSSCRLFFSLKECLSVIVPGENINSPNLNLQPFFFIATVKTRPVLKRSWQELSTEGCTNWKRS